MRTLEILSVPVSDQQRAKEFYLKLGLTLITEAAFGDQTWIQLGFPGGGTSITLVNWFPSMPAGCLQGATISCEDIGQEVARLKESGIQTGKIDDTPWGKFASVKDPDGNTWSLHEEKAR